MTKEELEKEAENNKPPYAYCAFDIHCGIWEDGFIKGAYPREKRIAELEAQIEKETTQRIYNFNKSIEWKEKHRGLEKENAELKKKLKEKIKTIADKDLSFVAKFDALESENAELNAQIEELKEKHKQDELSLIISNSSARAELEKQLEQAKKYLEECVYNVVSPKRLRENIEQFLKSSEVEK